MRLYPAAPLSVPRESIEDCTVNGYHIPKGTQLFINVYKIHRDPSTWQDPCEFRPERFLTTHKDYDVRGQNYDFMTFGSGRRICPGISFALSFMQFTLASLLQGFDISTPTDKTVDMTEGAGLTNLKATPLDVVLTPRLPGHVYKLNTVENLIFSSCTAIPFYGNIRYLDYYLSPSSCLSKLLFDPSIFLRFLLYKLPSAKKTPPQPSGAWPLIGHVLLLGDLPHQSLAKLAEKYGPIFMIKIGFRNSLVISSPAMARECLGDNNDRVFVDRPKTAFAENLGFNTAMFGFSPYGPYWREIRKIVTIELLSNRRLEDLKYVKMSEVRSALKIASDDYRKSESGSTISTSVDMRYWFNDVSLNNIVRLIAGKSLKEFYQGDEYIKITKALRKFFDLGSTFTPADVLPFLRRLDIGRYEKTMKNVAVEIDDVAQVWLEEHKRRRVSEEPGIFASSSQGDYETLPCCTAFSPTSIWQDPSEFRPERFLTTHKHYDVRGQNYDFMPLCSGRRICPAISFALQFMQFSLASLLHGFEISTPMDKMVDLTEGAGLTIIKATPLEVILTPRLPGHLYDV